MPGIIEIQDKKPASLMPEQSKTGQEEGGAPLPHTPYSSSAADSSNIR